MEQCALSLIPPTNKKEEQLLLKAQFKPSWTPGKSIGSWKGGGGPRHMEPTFIFP